MGACPDDEAGGKVRPAVVAGDGDRPEVEAAEPDEVASPPVGSPPLVAAEVQVSPSFELSGNSIWDRRLHPYSASCLWSQLGLPAE